MGCGTNSRSEDTTKSPIVKSAQGQQNNNDGSPEIKDIGQLEINPSQFVFQKNEKLQASYTLKKKLGSGAFGTVYEAVHKQSGDRRAVKFVDKSAVSPEEEQKLFREIEILKQLDHPHIVKLYEFYSDSKFYYMITDLLEKGELFDEIQRRKGFSEELAADIMSQLLSAVVYCHARKIAHRDLKPENILIDSVVGSKMTIKVIDFGTALTYNPDVKLKTTTGTAYYIAPEVLMKNYDEKCDVWSCGVILYILLSGTPPFFGNTDEDIMRAVKKGKYTFYSPIWQDISDQAKDLVMKMLKFRPDQRLTAEAAFSHDWIQKKKFNQLKPETAYNLMNNLKTFHTEQKLQQAALMYIATQLMDKKEKEVLQQTFMALDKNADGKLSREELLEGYTTIYGNIEQANQEVEQIMKNVDSDNNGFIDYSEFLMASTNKKKLLSKENLKKAFDLFDKDSSGTISADEVKTCLLYTSPSPRDLSTSRMPSSA
eukprot:TRINITY_DN4306_c0_g1_i3.p1 TRINITY_DN4306_c0_g1~~TRINITY_DN4306_c0_g1_i3.p1  ORF type:complete len:484 (-),score=139.28 TRINITY_DN4306_c0_g1_i3:11-1462(-)